MPEYTFQTGKGLAEPCPPYRELRIFGADINPPDTEDWNCRPALADPAAEFDLSALEPPCEVVVALTDMKFVPAGNYYFLFRWYRSRDDKLLYELSYEVHPPVRAHVACYSYIGWLNWEINESGDYYVIVDVAGTVTYQKRLNFTVSGIPAEEPIPELPPIDFMGKIVVYMSILKDYFKDAHDVVEGWIWPFSLLADPLFWVSNSFDWLATLFTDFNDWMSAATPRLASILSWELIRDAIINWLPDLEGAIAWFADWWTPILTKLTEWWETALTTVKGWIEAATEGLAELLVAWDSFWTITWPDWTSKLDTLRGEWDNFWTVTFPTLVDVAWAWEWWKGRLTEVSELIDSKLKDFLPFRDSLAELWDKISEFFTDPEDWLYKALDRIIERFW